MESNQSPIGRRPEIEVTRRIRPVDAFQKIPSTASANRFILSIPHRAAATAIHYGTIGPAFTAEVSLMVRSSKILCVEDRLWDVPGGSDFAEKLSQIANTAGRSTMLLLSEPDCAFRNRKALKAFASARANLIAGELRAALVSYGLQRLDSLVPQLARLGTKAVLRRETHEPLFLDATVRSIAPHPVWSHGAYFWNSFLANCLEEFCMSGSLNMVGSNGVEAQMSLPNSVGH